LSVRGWPVSAVGELKPPSRSRRLLRAYGDPETKSEAVAALAQMPDPQAIDAYLDGLAGKNPTLRAGCRKAIEAIRDEALPAIEAKLNELSPETVAELQKIYTKHAAARRSWLFEAKAQKMEPSDYLDFALEQ